jgi:predicted DsbA family dithiol-disulfide isomerase
MHIEIWADVVCPWAYIGKRRLERALAAADGGVPTEVVWYPYRLDPTAPAPGVPLDAVLRDPEVDTALRSCAPALTPAENRARVSRIAADEGLGPRWGAAWHASSHDAHRLIALARAHGGAPLQDAVVEEVLHAHFVAARDISRPDVLADAAEAAGFAGAADLLAAGGGHAEVRERLLTGAAMGVATSPTIVVGGRALAGAQPPDVILAFLRDAVRDPRPRPPREVERLRHAEALLDRRDPLGALVLLGPLLAEHGGDRGVRTLAARAYYASAQLGRAEAALRGLVADFPDDSYARLLLGRTLERRGDRDAAAPHLAAAATMTPAYARP